MPVPVNDGRDFRWFDFGASAPKDVCIGKRNTDGFEVLIDGCFVGEDAVFFGAMNDAHDVDVTELRAAFAPVAVGHAEVASDFAAGFDFTAFGNGPVEESIEAGDTFAGFGVWFNVFEESGEPPDDFLFVQRFGDGAEFIE